MQWYLMEPKTGGDRLELSFNEVKWVFDTSDQSKVIYKVNTSTLKSVKEEENSLSE